MKCHLVPLFLAALPMTLACAKGAESRPAPPAPPFHVETLTATARPVPRTLALTGSLRAAQDSEVAAAVAGRVVRVHVERGTRLSAGQPIAELDVRASALAAEEEQAKLASAHAAKALADRECERAQRLFEKGAVTQQELEKTASECRTQGESVRAATSRLERARALRADGVIRAPFAGTVSERYVELGEYVQAGGKVAHLVHVDPLRLELTVPEVSVAAVRVGLDVAFTVTALPGRTFHGKVAYVAPSLRAATRDLVFETEVANPDGVLKPGMFAAARLDAGTEPLPVVPRTALREQGDTLRALVVRNGRIEERILETTPLPGDAVAIRAGVAVGERVVSRPTAALVDGTPVR